MEGTEELEEERYGDRWLHSFSNKPDTDEDAWHMTSRSFPGESCYVAVHPPAVHSAPLVWPCALHPSTSLAGNSKTLGNGLTTSDEPARMICNSQSFMFCPSFILSFIFTFLYPAVEIIFSIAPWTGGLRSNTATRQVKPGNCAW